MEDERLEGGLQGVPEAGVWAGLVMVGPHLNELT